MRRILLSVPHMGGGEQAYVRQAFTSNWLSTAGPNLTAFEQEFARRIGLPAVALNSGTAAIHLGLRLLGVATRRCGRPASWGPLSALPNCCF